jgi:cation transport ATPase
MKMALYQEWFLRLAFLIVALIHLLPLSGALGRSVLEKAYGIEMNSSSLQILLQHRAVLFGLLGIACLIATWDARWRYPVGIATLISAASFVLIAWSAPEYNARIARVVLFDEVAVVLLLLAGLVQYFRQH